MARSRRLHRSRRRRRSNDLLSKLLSEFTATQSPHGALERDVRQKERVSRRARGELRQRIDDLEYQLGTLMLLNRTLIELLREQPDWDEARFAAILKETDLEDGKLDDRAPSPREAQGS